MTDCSALSEYIKVLTEWAHRVAAFTIILNQSIECIWMMIKQKHKKHSDCSSNDAPQIRYSIIQYWSIDWAVQLAINVGNVGIWKQKKCDLHSETIRNAHV